MELNVVDKKEKNNEKNVSLLKKINWTNPKLLKILGLFAVLCIGIVLYINFSSNKTNIPPKVVSNKEYVTTLDYANSLETKIIDTLSNMVGIGKVKVMITLINGVELILAENVDERTNTTTNQNSTTTNDTKVKEPIIINKNGTSQPLILYEKLPNVKGVVVVAEGAKDINIRLNIMTAVKTLLDIPSSNIQVFS